MITVTICKENQCFTKIQCKGHAGYAKHGQDIVCAAVSILVINTINALEALVAQPMHVESDEETGFIRCSIDKPYHKESDLLVQTMIMGIQSISEQYGKRYVDLTIKEV